MPSQRRFPATIGYYSGGEGTIYVSDDGFVTRPQDSPGSTHFPPRVKLPASLRRDIIAPGRTFLGRTQARYGDIVITNPDGALDDWFGYAFSGREFVQYVGSGLFPSGYQRLVTTTMDEAAFSLSEIRIKLRDRVGELDRPVQTNLYAGTGGLEGGSDIKSKRKPLLFGYQPGIRPVLVDAVKLIYDVNNSGHAITMDYGSGYVVFEGGVGIAQDATPEYASEADLLATAPAAGTWRYYPAGGKIRLGSSPTLPITCNASTSVNTVGALWAALMTRAVASNLDSTVEARLDADNSGTIGLWLGPDDRSTYIELIDRGMRTIGGWWGADANGTLTAAVLKDPSTQTSSYTFPEAWVDDLQRVPVTDEFGGVPVWRTTATWAHKTPLAEGELAALAVPGGSLIQAYSVALGDSDSSILTAYPDAPELEIETLFTSSAVSPSTEAERQFDLRSVKRDLLRFRSPMRTETLAVDLGQYVTVPSSRYGLSAGKNFVVTSVAPDARAEMIQFEVWG